MTNETTANTRYTATKIIAPHLDTVAPTVHSSFYGYTSETLSYVSFEGITFLAFGREFGRTRQACAEKAARLLREAGTEWRAELARILACCEAYCAS